jgi:hypothetical protein
MKREIPLLLAFLAGTGMILAFFIPTPFFKELENTLSNWTSIVIAFAIFLALFSLIRIHGDRISRQEPDWVYSAVLLGTLFITTCSGIFYGVSPYYPDYVILEKAQVDELVKAVDAYGAAKASQEETLPVARAKVLKQVYGTVRPILGTLRTVSMARNLEELGKTIAANRAEKKDDLPPRADGPFKGQYVVQVTYYNVFQWLYDYVYTPLQATMFSLLAFYMASAAFRAFRARTIEGTLLLAAAFLVMIGRTSVGYWLNTKFCWLPFPAIQEWIMSVPTTAGQRAVMIGAALGVVSASLRMLLGLEQTYLGGE